MCYTAPLAASVVTTIVWTQTRSPKIAQLNLMLYGAVIFGVVDHWWHGELFMFSGNLAKDLLLGVTITAGVFLAWGVPTVWNKAAFFASK